MCTITRWLDVEVGTNDIDLNTLPSNICLIDLSNDNEYKLVIGDLGGDKNGPKIKIFKGAMQTSDIDLPDIPLGVIGLYMSETMPRSTPVIAVAFSTVIYIYRNMKLFFKYYLPSIEWNSAEMNIWNELVKPETHKIETITLLTESLRLLPQNILSRQSQQFLQLNTEQQLDYLDHTPEVPMRKTPEITAITSLRISSVDKYAMSCLVVATEDGEIVFLDPHTFQQVYQANVCETKKTPYQIIATGLYHVDFRILVSTRERCVCVVKRGMNPGRLLFTTDQHIVNMEVMTTDYSVIVICIDSTMACYSKKGKKLWSIKHEDRPIALTLLPINTLGLHLIGVALASGHVYLYDGNAKVDQMFIKDVVSAMKFGQLGQEEHVLTIVTTTGNLMIKILKRTADFNLPATGVESAPQVSSGQRPWLIPKKSKLFIEQSLREKENAYAMHEDFQRELNRLRLTVAKTLIEAHMRSDNCIGAGPLEPVRLSAEVEGLGPVFRMTLVLHNTSTDKSVLSLAILFHYTVHYKVSNPYIKIPLLTPGNKLEFPIKIEEIFTDLNPDVLFRGVTGQGGDRCVIKMLLLKEGRQSPVLAATVEMPPTDPLMLPFDKMQATADFK